MKMDINQSPSGKIIKSPKGYSAFLPNNLPPEIKWDAELATSLSRADFLIGQLAREGGRLPNPHLLIRPFVAREAVLSSRIEGTVSTLGEILSVDAGVETKQNPEDLQEVQNYITALNYGLKRLEELPLSLRLLREVHLKLMQGARGSHATPGEFRLSQNWIGHAGCTINNAKFVPPPAENLMECLGGLESFFHDNSLPPLIHIALCHYQFEAIHPFLDGNGRIGRLLIILLLINKKILPTPILYLSAFFEATRNEYYKNLYNVSSSGTWNEWLIYFLNGIAIQSEDVLSRAERINNLLNKWKVVVAIGGSKVGLEMVDCFAVNPYLTINKIAETLKIAYSTAQRSIQKLEKIGIIKKINNSKRNQVFCSTEILKILEEPTKIWIDK